MRAESRLSWYAVAAGCAMCAWVAAVGADARWLAALGALISHAGDIPSSIPYADAPSDNWVNVPVLGELIFHWLEALGGDRGLVLAQAAAVAAMLAFVARDMRAAGASDAARAAVLLALPFAAVASLFVVRVQLFSLPLYALTVLLLRAEARQPSRRIWLLVPLFALWSNLHGAVLTGLAVASVYLVVERFPRDRVRSVCVLVASWLALFATPALGHTGDYYLGVLHSEPAASGFGMWAPLSLSRPFDVLFVAIALPLLLLAVRSRPRIWELLCFVVLIAATVHVGRNSIWLLLFVATHAAVALRFTRRAPSNGVVRAAAWVVLVALLVTAMARTPVQTVAGSSLRAKAESLAGGRPILADPENAEALALDGRRVWIANPIDAFTRSDQRAYLAWLKGDLALHDHDVVLVQRDSGVQKRVARDATFREVARDEVAVLYRRAS
ncbi:MAG: hypothetical protein ACJ74R_13115 [Gaiellaceae bacterium]